MKQILALILVSTLLFFGVFSLSAAAEDSPIIGDSLQKEIDERDPEEQIVVAVWVKSEVKPIDRMPSWPDREKARLEMKAIIAADIQSFLESIPDDIEYEADALKLTPMVFLRIKVKDAERIAKLDKTIVIDYVPSDDETGDPPVPWEEKSDLAQRFEFWMWKQNIVENKKDNPELLEYRDYEELAVKESWALIKADVIDFEPWEYVESRFFADRIISWWHSGAYTYPYGLFVYDAAKETFVPIEEVDPAEYAGLSDSMNELKIGRPLGDADNDKELTILDATCIQRYLVELEDIDEETDTYWLNMRGAGNRFSDYDRDNDITILDATAIQRRLAGLE